MADYYLDIARFHEKFGLAYDGPPRNLDDELLNFRLQFMFEELKEFTDAAVVNDIEGMFDALIDLTYVALGTAHMMGLDFDEGWLRVHAANMKKVRASSADVSKRGSQYDVVKPEGWEPPDLSDLVPPKEFNFGTD